MTAKPPVRWLIDAGLATQRHYAGQPSLIEAARELGYTVHESRYKPRDPDTTVPFGLEECVVAYGSYEFIRQVRATYKGQFWTPGDYCRVENLSYQATTARYGEHFLNNDYVLMPFGEVVRRRTRDWGGAIFLKPDGVGKAFTGFVVTEDRFDAEISSLRQISHVHDDLLCVVARPKVIQGEFRYTIADRRRVAGSEYRWDNILDVRSDTLPICDELADHIARQPWQPDRVYTLDICAAEIDGTLVPRIVEFNSFSCAGLYASDTRAIVEAVSTAAWREHEGEDEID